MSTPPKKTETLSVRVCSELKASLDRYAAGLGRDSSSVARELLVRELQERSLMMARYLPPTVEIGQYGPQAKFFSDDGQQHVGVMTAAYRHTTNLVVFNPADPMTPRMDALGIHPLLDDVIAFIRSGSYDWDHPHYRELCTKLNLDPDRGRPQFRAEDQELVFQLDQALNRRSRTPHTAFIFDLIECLRTDHRPDIQVVERVQREMIEWEDDDKAALFQEALSRIDTTRLSGSSFTLIRFLPSASGGEFLSSIYGTYTENTPDGWPPGSYDRLRGIALEPDGQSLWVKTVRKRLSEQGVIFLSREEARQYLDGEGAYWAYVMPGTTPEVGLEPRPPSPKEALLWRVKKPKTPLSDRAHGLP